MTPQDHCNNLLTLLLTFFLTPLQCSLHLAVRGTFQMQIQSWNSFPTEFRINSELTWTTDPGSSLPALPNPTLFSQASALATWLLSLGTPRFLGLLYLLFPLPGTLCPWTFPDCSLSLCLNVYVQRGHC